MKKTIINILTLISFSASFWVGPFVPFASAAALTALSDTLSTAKISTLSSHTIKFTTPTGTSTAGQTIVITFPSDFDFTSKTIGTVTFTHGATTGAETTETLAASASATAWGAVFSGTANRVLTLTAPIDGVGTAALAASDKVIISYTSANSTNATSAGSFVITIGGTFPDSGSITLTLVTNDQVAVSATVNQTLSFAISSNSISFGTLDSAAARYANTSTGSASEVEAHTLTAATNSSSGYTISVNGVTLTAGGFTILAIGATNTASSAGSEQFGLRMTATGGSGSVVTKYSGSGFAYDSAALPSAVATSSGTSATTTYSVRYLANISPTTEPGSYSTTLTYVATGNF